MTREAPKLGFVKHMKVNKTPNTLESGGKIDIFSSAVICQVSLEEFKRAISSEIFSSLNRFQSSLGCAACSSLGVGARALQEEGGGEVITSKGRRVREGKQKEFPVHLSKARCEPS